MWTLPIVNTASFHLPPAIKGSIISIIMSLTNELIRSVDATPIIKAIAKEITLCSFKNATKSFIKLFVLCVNIAYL